METYREVAPDIYQVCLPLPFALRSVNCYLLRAEEGWMIIDAGLNVPEARAIWQATFAALGIGPDDLKQIILTHVHPDHFGLAGWLQAWSGAPVLASPREAELTRQIWESNNLPQAVLELAGMESLPETMQQGMIAAVYLLREMTLPHPQRIDLIEPGATLPAGRRRLTALHAPGHSDGQLLFYDAADRLLLCGDQVLQKITPNIGLWPISEPDPLGRYLASLRALAGLEVRLALPGHGSLITAWQTRLAELEQHHAERLAAMLAAINGVGSAPYDICAQIFEVDKLTEHEMRFALAETLSHLEYLVGQGQLRREVNGHWTYWRAS